MGINCPEAEEARKQEKHWFVYAVFRKRGEKQ